ncbi:hypothetical protein BH11BAC2_BH11BAC2_03280 [soil metagenome]
MKKYFKPILFLFVASALFSACKKDSAQSNTDKLSGKDWKVTAETISPAIDLFGTGTLVTDLYNQPLVFPDCSKDDFTNFKSAGTYLTDEGATKCDAADPQTIAGTWTWNSDETVLTMTDNTAGSTPTSFTIITNDGTTLSGTSTEVINSITYTITVTFKKK